MMFRWTLCAALLFTSACATDKVHSPDTTRSDAGSEPERAWAKVFTGLSGALMSVAGSSPHDVWAAGSDTHDGRGPLLLHFDGTSWVRQVVTSEGDLWWVHPLDRNTFVAGGSKGMTLVRHGARFTRIASPATPGTVFGIWGASENDLWAVGGDIQFGTGAFVWRTVHGRFVPVANLPVDLAGVSAFFKVWGSSASDVWIVGTGALLLHYDGRTVTKIDTGLADDPLFTVHGTADGKRVAAVGGTDLGVVLERRGGTWPSSLLPAGTHQLFGVWVGPTNAVAVGDQGAIVSITTGAWSTVSTGLDLSKALHAVWQDSDDGVWAVGGDVLTPPLGQGVLVHYGALLPTTFSVRDGTLEPPEAEAPEAGTDATIDAAPVVHEGGAGGAPSVDGALSDATVASGGNGGADAGNPGAGGAPAAGGAPSTDAGSLPTKVRCGAAVCSLPAEQCCADVTTGVPSGCIPASSTCQATEAPVTCDESADCAPGESCCLDQALQVGDLVRISCQASCGGPTACESTGGCTLGFCATFGPKPSWNTCH